MSGGQKRAVCKLLSDEVTSRQQKFVQTGWLPSRKSTYSCRPAPWRLDSLDGKPAAKMKYTPVKLSTSTQALNSGECPSPHKPYSNRKTPPTAFCKTLFLVQQDTFQSCLNDNCIGQLYFHLEQIWLTVSEGSLHGHLALTQKWHGGRVWQKKAAQSIAVWKHREQMEEPGH